MSSKNFNFNKAGIGSNEISIEIVKSDEYIPLSLMETNQQPAEGTEEGPKTEAEIVNEEDQGKAEHGRGRTIISN